MRAARGRTKVSRRSQAGREVSCKYQTFSDLWSSSVSSSHLEQSGLAVSVAVVVTVVRPGLGVLLQQRPQRVSSVEDLHTHNLTMTTTSHPSPPPHLLDEAVRILRNILAPIITAHTGMVHC